MPERVRKSGSNRGRPAIDWEAAFAYYASLPAEGRTYQAVASHYGVSVRTVEKHGLYERWRKRTHQIERDAAAKAAAQLSTNRAHTLARLERLVDESEVVYEQDLRAGNVRVLPADLTRLHKLRKELWQDQNSEPQDPASEQLAPNSLPDTHERKLEVLRGLRDAGVLERWAELANEPDAGKERDEQNEVGSDGTAEPRR